MLSIGALATYTDLIRSPLVRRRLPILAAAAREIGGVQIQNRGTIGGNVANASPAGDTLPVLAVADAVVVLRSAAGTRRVPVRRLLHRLPRLACAGPTSSSRRSRSRLSSRGAAVVPQGRHARRAGDLEGRHRGRPLGAAPRSRSAPSRRPSCACPRTEAVLAAGGSIARPETRFSREIQPIDDVRSTAEYRRRVSANLLEQFWRETA